MLRTHRPTSDPRPRAALSSTHVWLVRRRRAAPRAALSSTHFWFIRRRRAAPPRRPRRSRAPHTRRPISDDREDERFVNRTSNQPCEGGARRPAALARAAFSTTKCRRCGCAMSARLVERLRLTNASGPFLARLSRLVAIFSLRSMRTSHTLIVLLFVACRDEAPEGKRSAHEFVGGAKKDPVIERAIEDLKPFFVRYCKIARSSHDHAFARAQLASQFKKSCHRDYPADDADVRRIYARVGTRSCNYRGHKEQDK